MFAKNNSTLNLLNKAEYADGLRDGSGSPQTCLSVARTTSEQPEQQFLTGIEPPTAPPTKNYVQKYYCKSGCYKSAIKNTCLFVWFVQLCSATFATRC